MILHESKTVPIAEADWTNDGTVELVTFSQHGHHITEMSPDTARALADQLLSSARDAERAHTP